MAMQAGAVALKTVRRQARPLRVGVLELLAKTAVIGGSLSPAFWVELAVKRQLYSVMPQAVSVWCRQAGCQTHYATFVGLGRPEDLLPADLDLVFLSTPTQHAGLAYALTVIFRRRGAPVVLGGPHARAYPQDCARFADIVVTDCDRRVVQEILAGVVTPGAILRAASPLDDLPLVEEREPEIRAAAFVGGRQRRTTTIALVSSLGCPYACDFCSEWATPYQAFDTDRMRHELETIAARYPGALIGFHDPNFGVRFDQIMTAFETAPRLARNPFVMEASLSLLNRNRLARLRDAGCLMVAPGVESWADYSNKSGATRFEGEAKYAAVAERMDEIEAHIPAIQVNMILGVDADAGDEPFTLTERFIAARPKVWTNVNVPIPFGDTPFARRVRKEGRLVEAMPFPLYTAPYAVMRPRNYALLDYLRRLEGTYSALVSPRLLYRRLQAAPSGLARTVVLAGTVGLRVELSELRAFARALASETDLRRFMEGEADILPRFLAARLRDRLGRYAESLPENALRPLRANENDARLIVTI